MNSKSFNEYVIDKIIDYANTEKPDYRCAVSQYEYLTKWFDIDNNMNHDLKCENCECIIVNTEYNESCSKICTICDSEYCDYPTDANKKLECLCGKPHNCADLCIKTCVCQRDNICNKCISNYKQYSKPNDDNIYCSQDCKNK